MTKPDRESELVEKGPCPECGSSDACALYDDGHRHCFSCGTHFPPDGEDAPKSERRAPRSQPGLVSGAVEPLKARKIDLKTAEKFGYRVGRHRGRIVQIAPYHDATGRVVAQKLRDANKDMPWVGDKKAALPLFAQALWQDGGRMVVVTEGEIDAMSVAQAMGLKWPVVSLPDGASSAAKAVGKASAWLERFDRVVLMFDMDEPGREAAVEAARQLTPGKAYIAKIPLKDANEMLKAGRSGDIVRAVWDAQPYRPDGIIRVADLIDEAVQPTGYGFPWPWRGLTEATYGQRRRELYGWGAGVGVGKTTLFKQLMLSTMMPELIADHDGLPPLNMDPRPVGTLLLEENPRKTLKTLAGMAIGKRIHVPGVDFDMDEARAMMERLDPYLFAYDHFGAKDWEGIKDTIRYMVLGEGVKDIFLDHLTALTSFVDDDRKSLDVIMADLASMVEQYEFTLHYVSHLTTPDGKAHEEGGRVQERHFTGSRAIARWSHNMFGLERDKQTPDEPTVLRILKERETGDATGTRIGLAYNRDTGLFVEVPPPPLKSKPNPFKDETRDTDF